MYLDVVLGGDFWDALVRKHGVGGAQLGAEALALLPHPLGGVVHGANGSLPNTFAHSYGHVTHRRYTWNNDGKF